MVEPITYFCTSGSVTSACFYEPPTGHKTFLLAGTGGGDLFCWDLKSCSLVQSTNVFKNPVLWIGIHQDRMLIIQARFDTNVKIFLMKEDNLWLEVSELTLVAGHVGFCPGGIQENVSAFPTSQDGLSLQEVSDSGVASLMVQIENGKQDGMLTSVKLALINNQLAIISSFESGKVQLGWLTNKTFQIKSEFQFQIKEFAPLTLDFDVGKLCAVVAGSGDKVISLKLDAKLDTFSILTERKIPTNGISCLQVRTSDKKVLICGSWDSTIKIFSWIKPERLKPLGALKFHSEAVNVVTCTKGLVKSAKIKGQLFAAGSKDGKVSLWSIYNDI